MSRSSSISQIYAHLPRKLVRRVVMQEVVHMNISTANLRKLLNDKATGVRVGAGIKNRLYQFLLVRQQAARKRRGHV